MIAADLSTIKSRTVTRIKRRQVVSIAVPAFIAAYFLYIFFAFDIAGLAKRANWDNAIILASDSWSYKVHVTRSNHTGKMSYAVEGERKGAYPEGERPDWVSGTDIQTVDLGKGYVVRFLPDARTEIDVPGYGLITAQAKGREITTNLGAEAPDWINASDRRVAVKTPEGRVTITGSKTEVFKYFPGWELFWFTFDSPYHGASLGTLLFGGRLDPYRSNVSGAVSDWWNNAMWRHKDVAWALGETMLMAFLGTFGAAIIALPLGFIAAKRFTPFALLRASARRLFDLLRGVDALIWTVVLARAFGPGPLTGSLAILLTDTGTFGKVFSEALENVDDKQVEGVSSTGAKPLQRYRFGVIPQVMPVLLAQVLYFLESNTRSATVIGAITGGGIGLMLTQAIQTQKDWEEVGYYITLVILMVMFMDWFSGRLRAQLIGRKG